MSVIFNPAAAGTGGGMTIGGAIAGGTTPDYLFVGPGAVLAQAAPGALTKADDTNVMMTLGGTPASALLQAVSMTLGWTGLLAVTRGGTGLGAASQGDLLYGSGVNTYSSLTKSTTATRYLANTGTSNNPQWDLVNLANGITGNLPVSALNSGTGASSTTFWRGDGTWATPAGGGGGGMAIGGAVTGGTDPAILYISGGNLAQDPTNLGWDSTNKALLIESNSALYRVPNASGDNWFEGAAGNFTVTGNSNFGTGANALLNVSSGTGNVAVGVNALQNLTTASNNVAFGAYALFHCNASANFALGTLAMQNTTSGATNVAIGTQALQQCALGGGNIAIGYQNSLVLVNGGTNVAIGSFALGTSVSDNNNVAIGNNALGNLNGNDNNVAIGNNAGSNISTGGYNTCIGFQSGSNISSGSANIVMGYANHGSTTGGFNFLIGSQQYAPGAGTRNVMIGPSCGQSLLAGGSYNTWLGGFTGSGAIFSNTIVLSDGQGNLGLDYSYTNLNTWTFAAAFIVTPVATASLPAAGVAGRRHFVTDANATTFASIVAGGGANKIAVYDDGTNWRIG